jgi:DNA-binding response OmpR family regulator
MTNEETTSRARVLLAEDEKPLAEVYMRWLESAYDVTLAHDGGTALEAYDGHDVVLLDRMMPELSGGDTLERLRERGVTVPVALITAVDPGLDVIEMEFDEYLCKPIDRDEIQDLTARLLERTKFDDNLRRHYALAAKLATLEEHVDKETLTASDEYASLEREFDTLDEELFAASGALSDADLLAVLDGEQP